MGMAQDFLRGAGGGVRAYKERLQADLESALGLAGSGIDWGTRQIGGAVQSAAEGAEAFRQGYEGGGPPGPPQVARGTASAAHPGAIREEDLEFERRLLEAGEGGLDGLGPPPKPPYPPPGSEVMLPELSEPEQETAEMEALKERLGFEWATEVDPRTGRPAQPRTVNLPDTGDPGGTNLYTPPKESRGANVSDMRSQLERMAPAQRAALPPERLTELEADMTPTQERAYMEGLAFEGEARRRRELAQDPFAAERARAGIEAEAGVAGERGKAGVEAETRALYNSERKKLEENFLRDIQGLIGMPEEAQRQGLAMRRDQLQREIDDLRFSFGFAKRTVTERTGEDFLDVG